MAKNICLEDIIDIFLTMSIYDIKCDKIVPNVNFKFVDEQLLLFKDFINNPDYRLHKPSSVDLKFLIEHSDDDCPSINIIDGGVFFRYLFDIVNETVHLVESYGEFVNPYMLAKQILMYIWLRMGLQDFNSGELFYLNSWNL